MLPPPLSPFRAFLLSPACSSPRAPTATSRLPHLQTIRDPSRQEMSILQPFTVPCRPTLRGVSQARATGQTSKAPRIFAKQSVFFFDSYPLRSRAKRFRLGARIPLFPPFSRRRSPSRTFFSYLDSTRGLMVVDFLTIPFPRRSVLPFARWQKRPLLLSSPALRSPNAGHCHPCCRSGRDFLTS